MKKSLILTPVSPAYRVISLPGKHKTTVSAKTVSTPAKQPKGKVITGKQLAGKGTTGKQKQKKLPLPVHPLPLTKTKNGLFRLFKSKKDGKYYWSLISKNSQVVAQSEGYNQMPHAIKGMKAVIKCAKEGVYFVNNVLLRFDSGK